MCFTDSSLGACQNQRIAAHRRVVLCGIEISVLRIRVHELLDLYVRMQHRTCYGRAVCVL